MAYRRGIVRRTLALMTTGSPPLAQLEFDCPRCRRAATELHYGPCRDCRADLRRTQVLESRQHADAEYVPKMNVTPNAVASKE